MKLQARNDDPILMALQLQLGLKVFAYSAGTEPFDHNHFCHGPLEGFLGGSS
jgi:hypothetical protein